MYIFTITMTTTFEASRWESGCGLWSDFNSGFWLRPPTTWRHWLLPQ